MVDICKKFRRTFVLPGRGPLGESSATTGIYNAASFDKLRRPSEAANTERNKIM